MSFAVRAEGISKSYILGAGAHVTLKDAVSSLFARLSGGARPDRRILWALEDIDLEIKEGEAVGLIGHNGAGKSTLFKLLARITLPTKGEAFIRGRVGSLLEVGTGFHPELTGRDNILLNGAVLGMSRAETLRKFDDIVGFAEVSKFVDTPVKRYSSGMQMRLAFSVAAHLEPDVMLIDEVLAVGDQEFQNRCMGRVQEIEQEGRTVLFVSHNMGAVRRLCNRGILLDRGQIAADGPIEAVTQKYYELIAPEALNAEDDETAGRPLRLRNWGVDAGGRFAEYVVPAGTPCTLTFDLHSEQAVQHAYVRLTIFTPDGIIVSVLDTLDGGGFAKIVPGGFRAVLRTPGLPLSAGLYDLHLEILSRRLGRIESWDVRPSLRVIDETRTDLPGEAARGLVAMPADFVLETSDETSAQRR